MILVWLILCVSNKNYVKIKENQEKMLDFSFYLSYNHVETTGDDVGGC